MISSDNSSVSKSKPVKPPRLFRLFLIVSLGLMVMITLVARLGLNFVFRANVIAEAERNALHISTALSTFCCISKSLNFDGTERTPISPQELASLDREMRAFLVPFHIVKIKIFAADTRIIYSTDPSIIGKWDKDNAMLAAALGGTPSSKFETKDNVWDLAEEERFDVDIVETYIPIYGKNGGIIGSFEIYKDVTEDLARADSTLLKAMGVLLATLIGVFSVLAFIMYCSSNKTEQGGRGSGGSGGTASAGVAPIADVPTKPNRAALVSSLKVFGLTVALLFVCEAIVMMILHTFNLRGLWDIVLDPVLLSFLSAPLLYYVVLRPLRRALEQLREAKNGLEKTNRQFATANQELRVTAEKLRERVKELTCLYGISQLIAEPGKRVDGVIAGVVDLLPPGWQYPSITCARITVEGEEFASANFRETAWKQTAEIAVEGVPVGTVEVCYLEEKPELDEGPFLVNERDLINNIARQLAGIIHRKRAERELELSARRWQMTFDGVADSICLLDCNAIVLQCNRAAGQLAGKAPAECAGRICCELIHGVTGPMVNCPFRRMLKTGSREVQELTEGGRHLRVTVDPLLNEAGEVTGAVHVISDVTEQKRTEEQFRQAQKMEAVGQLAGGIAHDFRNQLQVIQGFGSMLLRRGHVAEEGRENMEEILAAADRSVRLTSQLLAFSRREMLRPEVIDPAELIRDLQKLLPQMIGKDIHLLVDMSHDADCVNVDSGLFQQAVINLALNARDAMPQGGKLAIAIESVDLDAGFVAQHDGAHAGKFVMISVRDTGVGMNERIRSQVFDPFFTTKEEGEGTGLGLSMVYGFVKQSNGIITCDSEEGKGTTFRLYFPAVDPPAAKPGIDKETAEPKGESS